MARIRSVKPGFFTSIPIANIPDDSTRLHFIGLWTYADDDGRGVDDARLIKAAVWPLDEKKTAKRIEAMQAELYKRDRIIRYEVDGRRYFQITPDSWQEHQHVNRPQASVIPTPNDGTLLPKSDTHPEPRSERSVKPHGPRTARSRQEGLGREGLGREGFLASDGAITERDVLWDSVMDACGVERDTITPTARGGYNRAVADLRSVGASASEVRRRTDNYRRTFPQAALTPNALAKHWAALDQEPTNGTVPKAWDGIRAAVEAAQ